MRKRAEVHLKGTFDWQASWSFAKLHRLDHNMWDAWLHPAHLDGHTVRKEPPERLTPTASATRWRSRPPSGPWATRRRRNSLLVEKFVTLPAALEFCRKLLTEYA